MKSAAASDNLTAIERLRAICLALPEATEQEAWGEPTFRVVKKIFAMVSNDDGRPSVWCKSLPELQEVLVESDPGRYFVPPYLGHKGWVGIRLEGNLDWDDVIDLIEESYQMIAPKRLRTQVP